MLRSSSSILSLIIRSDLLAFQQNAQYAIKIYTRGGDKGRSSLFNGERRSKTDPVFHALGSLDELSAHLGTAKAACLDVHVRDPTSHAKCAHLADVVHHIQSTLMRVGSHLATPADTPEAKKARTGFDESLVGWVEACIDRMDQQLPDLTMFIIPSGGISGSFHVARAMCRRFERDLVRVMEGDQDLNPGVGKYANRLSDFFFTAARYVDHLTEKEEVIFQSAAFLPNQHPDPHQL